MQKITLQRLSIDPSNPYGYNTLEVSLSYDKGGMSYVVGEVLPRGYTLYVIPHKVENGIRKTLAYDGGKKFVKETKRFNQKEMEAVGAQLLLDGSDLNLTLKYVMGRVTEKNGFEVLSQA